MAPAAHIPASRPDTGPLPHPFALPDTRSLIRPPDGRLRIWQEKRWCYAGVVHPEFILGAAMAHLGYVTQAFAYVFDRRTRKITQAGQVFPPLGKMAFDPHPTRGNIRFRAWGNRLEIQPTKDGHHLFLEFPGAHLQAEIHFSRETLEPRHFYMPMHDHHRAFTTKAAGLKATGTVRAGGRAWALNGQGRGLFDWTHGVYPRQTQWNWACGAGTTDQNLELGFNFSRGVYEYGQLENTVWIDGAPFATPEIQFDYHPKQPQLPWKIYTRDGRVNLTFTPEGIRQKRENLLLVQSAFIQPCGSFQGQIQSPDGQVHRLNATAGVTEEHFARW